MLLPENFQFLMIEESPDQPASQVTKVPIRSAPPDEMGSPTAGSGTDTPAPESLG